MIVSHKKHVDAPSVNYDRYRCEEISYVFTLSFTFMYFCTPPFVLKLKRKNRFFKYKHSIVKIKYQYILTNKTRTVVENIRKSHNHRIN